MNNVDSMDEYGLIWIDIDMGNMDIWIYGYMDVWIYGYMDIWIYGYSHTY